MIYFAFPSLFPPLLYRSFVRALARRGSRGGREREREREREKKNSNYVYIVCIYARGDVFVTSITYLGGSWYHYIYIYILHHLRYLVLFLSIEILCYTTSLLLLLLLSHS